MSSLAALDLDEAVNGQNVGARLLLLGAVTLLAMMSDGFDLGVLGYIAPELVKEWGLTRTALVPAFSASIIGLLVGGPLLGMLGDRFGRRRIILGGLLAMGVLTLATIFVGSTTELVVLRFFTGIALGGVVPNVGALVAELTPKRVRGRMLVVVMLGAAIGVAMPGLFTAALVPQFGWRSLMIVGGIFPLLVALAGAAYLPESVKYLAQRPDKAPELRATAARLRPDLAIGADTRIFLSVPAAHGGGSVRQIFAGDFRIVTPLLWFAQAAIHLANFFALTWLPTLLQSAGASTSEAGIHSSLFSLGGVTSGLLLIFTLDRIGVLPLVIFFLVSAPLVAMMTMNDVSPFVHGLIIAGAGFCVLGAQLAITTLQGLFYPTAIRSTGAGWTQAAGRVGALGAPIIGGTLIEMQIRTSLLPLAPGVVLFGAALAAAALAWMCWRRFGEFRPQEFDPDAVSPAKRTPQPLPLSATGSDCPPSP